MLATLLLAASSAAQQPAQPPAPPPPACETPEHRQFDFWVGNWDVYPTGTDRLVAHSLIERRYNGCAIRENWMPLQGQGGGSFSAWRPEARGWRQTWVDFERRLGRVHRRVRKWRDGADRSLGGRRQRPERNRAHALHPRGGRRRPPAWRGFHR